MGSCTDMIGKTLVRRLDDMAAGWLCAGLPDADLPAEAARELERLSAEVAELDALRDKLAGILSRAAVALRGPEPPLTRWSWHDLPERAAAAIAAIALVQVAERARPTPRPTPLTYDAAHAIFEGWYHDDEGGVEFVRRVEAAHGIGEA